MPDSPICPHIESAADLPRSYTGCEECLKTGDTWVNLRLCLVCGHVGCCDSSKNTHATKHFQATGHPVVRSAQPNESWRYCYIDQVTDERNGV